MTPEKAQLVKCITDLSDRAKELGEFPIATMLLVCSGTVMRGQAIEQLLATKMASFAAQVMTVEDGTSSNPFPEIEIEPQLKKDQNPPSRF